MMEDDRLNEAIRRMNIAGHNGAAPTVLPAGIQPRPSGWVCPKCGTEADTRCDPAPGTILGYHFSTLGEALGDGDQRPNPVSVIATEITERDASGNPTRRYHTIHCFNCFNVWQKRKMMEDIRANIPQLHYVGDIEPPAPALGDGSADSNSPA